MRQDKKKTNNVFKVAGAKSLKLKNKAKVVRPELKNVSVMMIHQTNCPYLQVLIAYVPTILYFISVEYKKQNKNN